MKKLTYAFALLLLAGVVREIKIHEQTTVKAQGIQPDRKNYVSRTMPVPFTLESALTLTSDAGAILKERELYAVKKNGDILRRLDRYRPPSAIPYSTLSRLGNASTHGVTYFHTTPESGGVTTGRTPDLGFFREYPLAAKQCVTPDPGVKFLRQEAVLIGGASHPAAVVRYTGDQPSMNGISWNSLEIGCLELKSVLYYETPEGGKATTLREPVSLSIGEPDQNLFATHQHDVDTAHEHVLPEQFEQAVVKQMTHGH